MQSNLYGDFDEPQIDLTPLIDCLFMLIIFFVLTMSFSKPVLEIVLPKVANGEVLNNERNEILLSVKDDGSLWVGKTAIDLPQLRSLLVNEPDKLLNIYMDEKAPFASFVKVVDVAKELREGRFVISTEAKQDASAQSSTEASGVSHGS